jgi:NDP-4-keto-2,6-dideoxyhexose 3-C-methyltransferase
MTTTTTACRICGNTRLATILNLGEQMLTGVFPTSRDQQVTRGPLQLAKCIGEEGCCGLVQLRHSYDLAEMYGLNYGYRSGLNASMVRHLHAKVAKIRQHVALAPGDLVVDIGSNDSTTLQAYPADLLLVGIDPTGVKFRSYYPERIRLIADFFSAAALERELPGRKAKVVTSFSMFYDLEDPLAFMRQVHDVLDDDGVWVFEQSYLPSMLATNSYDTACHEHLEYYALKQIRWMADRVGFTIVDVEFNDINGGSFSITARKRRPGGETPAAVEAILAREAGDGLDTLAPFEAFAGRVEASRAALLEFVDGERARGRRIAALGASTKGNVLLQYCGMHPGRIEAVGEVNAEKFGALTPGTWLPIVPEDDLLASRPDFLLILPWHFRKTFLQAPKFKGRRLVFPLPVLEVVEA